jgi:hypothetical protein
MPFTWEKEQEEAFRFLKQRSVERPVLALYNRDAHTELHTDASKHVGRRARWRKSTIRMSRRPLLWSTL